MLNLSKLFIAIFATLFSFLTAFAQGEWKWANYWSGSGGTSSVFFNHISNTAFDEEGFIYVFGTIGGQPTFNGIPFLFINNPQVYGSNNQTCLLAKFDTLGNMLWHKIVKASDMDAYSNWMEVKDNRVYISGNMSLDYVDYNATVNNVWLYYFDTLITGSQVHEIPVEQRRPPYKTGRYTYFATFDLDGNLLDNHFVATFTRESNAAGVRGEFGLCESVGKIAPFHIDNEGNTFVYTKLSYGGYETDPYTLVIDGDTNRKYDIYLPGSVVPFSNNCLNTGMMYKFSPNWELLYAKPMVDHTDGIATSWNLLGDSVNQLYTLYITGMSSDESDNMYLSGNFCLSLFGDCGGELNQYPVHIYWDSTHYSSMLDITSSTAMPFIIKYNTNGTVLWCNQMYTRGDTHNSAFVSWAGMCKQDNSIFLLGTGGYKLENNGLVYFDDESNSLQRYQQDFSNISFFARFDAQTGHYLNHGIVPASNALSGRGPTAINNRVFGYANIFSEKGIYQWRNDGEYIQTINISTFGDTKGALVQSNLYGKILFNIDVTAPISFNNNVSANCPSGQSSAVFALYHDPSFAEPFVPDDTTDITDYFDKRESDINLYPNPTDGQTFICGYMYGYQSIELYDLQGRKLADLVEAWQPSSASTMQPIPAFDLSPYPAGTYLVKINFNRGVSVVRKVVKR